MAYLQCPQQCFFELLICDFFLILRVIFQITNPFSVFACAIDITKFLMPFLKSAPQKT